MPKPSNIARARASTALLEHELLVTSRVEHIRQDVEDGRLSKSEASKSFTDWLLKYEPPSIENLDPLGLQLLMRGIERNWLKGATVIQAICGRGA